MLTVWVIASSDEPNAYIADITGITYRAVRAKHYESKELADAAIQAMHLADNWRAVAFNTSTNSVA
jgi:hypothetical protein